MAGMLQIQNFLKQDLSHFKVHIHKQMTGVFFFFFYIFLLRFEGCDGYGGGDGQ